MDSREELSRIVGKSLGAVGYCSRKCELEAIKSSERSVRSRSTVGREISRREREKNVGKTDNINFNMEATKQKGAVMSRKLGGSNC